MSPLQRFLADKKGATAIEYALVASLIAMAIVAGVTDTATALKWLWNDSSSKIVQALSNGG